MYSTVRNNTGKRHTFGFLPPHGRSLAANEEFTVFGNIQDAIVGGIDRLSSRRSIAAFEQAIQDEDLIILNTPNPIFEDKNGHPKMLRLDQANNITVTDPCWSSNSA